MAIPLSAAGAGALLAFIVMRARMQVMLAKEHEELARAQAIIEVQKIEVDQRVRATEESVRRQALDEFIQDFRVEERSYVRETKSMFSARKLMVLQERLFFRSIPLSNWVEHEMLVEEGTDPHHLARAASAFGNAAVSGEGPSKLSRVLAQRIETDRPRLAHGDGQGSAA